MDELRDIRQMLDHEELVPKEETENMYWALKAVVSHVQDTQQYGYKVSGDYILWVIEQNLRGQNYEEEDVD